MSRSAALVLTCLTIFYPAASRGQTSTVVGLASPSTAPNPPWKGSSASPAFGTSSNSDTQKAGSTGLLVEFTHRWDKGSGQYQASRVKVAPSWGLTDRLSAGPALYVERFDIGGGTLTDRKALRFEGVAIFTKLQLRKRERGSGVAIEFTPQLFVVDPLSGRSVTSIIPEFKLVADATLAADRLFVGFNLKYEPTFTRIDGAWTRSSTLTPSVALAAVRRNVSLGVEARRPSIHNGLGLGARQGRALFIGPTATWSISDNATFSAVWGVQVDGRARGGSRGLDLRNFERNQVLVRLNATL